MSIFDNFRNWLLAPLMGDAWVERKEETLKRRDYGRGAQKNALKSKGDSVIINFCGLVLARGVAMLFGKGVEFDLPGDEETPEQVYIDTAWKLNKKGVLLHKIAKYGGEAGTWYAKLIPDALEDKDGRLYPRIVPQDPAWVEMETLPEDCDTVWMYRIAYNIIDPVTDKEVAKKQEISHDVMGDDGFINSWTIRDYQATSAGKWELIDEQVWDYSYPPIIHAQNLPLGGTPYGEPDITDDLIRMQDDLNFVVSNVKKIIKHHANPKTWGRLFGKMDKIIWGVDEMILSDNENAILQNLEMNSDLVSSMNFIQFLRQAIFDISRQVDIASINDRLGALTNFALQVLYQDATDKNETKRLMYGEALTELNERILDLAGFTPDAGQCKWPAVLPVNAKEQGEVLTIDQEAGRVSRQTAVEEQGRVWEDEQERIAAEKLEAGNIGASIIESFNRTGQ